MAWSKTGRHERGYGKAHEAMRKHLIATVILCEECERNGRMTPGSIADHKRAKAKGGDDSRSNYQLLCKACHDAKTIAEKGHQARPTKGVTREGRPTDPGHPWNRRK